MSLAYHRRFDHPLDGKYIRVIERLPARGRVLEVGCHTGYLLNALNERGYETSGIEYNENAVIEARAKGLNVVRGDIEDPKSFLNLIQKYDAVLLLDVLEHLRAPETALVNLRKLISSKGRLFITAPNVAYWAVRKNLLMGRWDYTDGGILDGTHLRFFTAKTWRTLIESAGYQVTFFSSADGMLPLEHLLLRFPGVSSLVPSLRRWAMKAFPSLFCISFLIEATPLDSAL